MPNTVIKKRVAVALLGLVISAAAFEAQAVTLRGSVSCGIWVKDREEKNLTAATHQRWLMGVMSGIAIGSNKDILKTTDAPSIFLWMDNYCRAKPLKDIDDGAVELFFELIKQNKL